MSWADKKIMEYKNGKAATFLEKRNLEHSNPVLFTFLVVAIIIFVWGTWNHNWTAIVAGMLVGFVGHIFVWTRK